MLKKSIKWWQKFSFWQKIRYIVGLFALGGEGANWISSSKPEWSGLIFLAGILTGSITFLFNDKNNNDIVDEFERINPKE